MNHPRDKTGREILPGDTLKVFHFTGARRKRHYMYKYVKWCNKETMKLSHLNLKKETYSLPMNGKLLTDCEIVQGYGEDYVPFGDREKKL